MLLFAPAHITLRVAEEEATAPPWNMVNFTAGRTVNESLSIQCPHCGETFHIALDVSEGSAEFIVDCEVCCRPMTVAVRVQGGEIGEVRVSAC